MKSFVALGVAVAAAAALPSPASAAPAAPTKVALINDCGNGSINGDCLSLDMVGTFAGVVKYRNKGNGDVRLVIQAKDAPANRNYTLEVYCGLTPAGAGTLIGSLPDALHTGKDGTGQSDPIEIPTTEVTRACGSGKVHGHIQLVDLVGGSILVAAPIDMTVRTPTANTVG